MSRWLRGLAAPLLAVVAITLAFRAPLPYFTEQPGSLFGLSARVEVEGYGDPLHGEVLFGTVNVRSATLAAAVRAALDRHVRLVRRERLLPEGLDADTFFAQQRAEFALATDVAAAVGLRAAGLPVDADALQGEGAVVLRVARGSPAHGELAPGDVITAVDETRVTTAARLEAVLADRGWDPLTLVVHRDDQVRRVRLTPAADRAGRPAIGVVPSTFNPRVSLPVAVRVDVDRVGGPSAGLAVALAVYDLVSPEDLLAGRRVAVTGSVDPEGVVGPIGGVEFKAVAAGEAGVDRLLVPAGQLETARAAAPPGLEIVGVAHFGEALDALRDGALASVCPAAGRSLYWATRRSSAGRVDGEVPCDVAP